MSWGQPPGGQGQGQGWGGQGPQQGYAPGGAQPQQQWGGAQGGFGQVAGNAMGSPQYAKIESDGQTWLIVGIVGWFFGAVMITGPLAWYMGNQLEGQCEQMGAPVPSNVKWAKMVGMISTILTILIVVGVMVMFMFVFGAVAAGSM